jgi:adenine C2-methylase RlmN of 23S rRNA A2503 and tRNA A37
VRLPSDIHAKVNLICGTYLAGAKYETSTRNRITPSARDRQRRWLFLAGGSATRGSDILAACGSLNPDSMQVGKVAGR